MVYGQMWTCRRVPGRLCTPPVPLRGVQDPVHPGYTMADPVPDHRTSPEVPYSVPVTLRPLFVKWPLATCVTCEHANSGCPMCDVREQQPRCAVTSVALDAVVEGLWKAIVPCDALARTSNRPTHQPERGGWTHKDRCIPLVSSAGLRLLFAGGTGLAQAHHPVPCQQTSPPPRPQVLPM